MNELRAGARTIPPQKPDCLILYELTENLPLVAGGLLDQPYIWTLQRLAISQEIEMIEAIQKSSEALSRGNNALFEQS